MSRRIHSGDFILRQYRESDEYKNKQKISDENAMLILDIEETSKLVNNSKNMAKELEKQIADLSVKKQDILDEIKKLDQNIADLTNTLKLKQIEPEQKIQENFELEYQDFIQKQKEKYELKSEILDETKTYIEELISKAKPTVIQQEKQNTENIVDFELEYQEFIQKQKERYKLKSEILDEVKLMIKEQ